jgi:hypothetical protein
MLMQQMPLRGHMFGEWFGMSAAMFISHVFV